MTTARRCLLCLLVLACPGAARAEPPVVEVTADPAAVRLDGPRARWSLLVHGKTADGTLLDLTRSATFRSGDPKVATVTDAGVVRGVADGSAAVTVEAAGK